MVAKGVSSAHALVCELCGAWEFGRITASQLGRGRKRPSLEPVIYPDLQSRRENPRPSRLRPVILHEVFIRTQITNPGRSKTTKWVGMVSPSQVRDG